MDIFSKKICLSVLQHDTFNFSWFVKQGMSAQNTTVTAPSDLKRKQLKEEFNVIETNSNRDIKF